MRYARFTDGGTPMLGLVSNDELVPLPALMDDAPQTLRAVIAAGTGFGEEMARRLTMAPASVRRPLVECRLLTPLPDPGKIVCLGLNYGDPPHRGGPERPEHPSLFLRVATSLVGPGEPMVVPLESEQLDFEAELMVVIGRTVRRVSEERALDAVFGYTAFNDGTVRDFQQRSTQWTAGKTVDGTGPMGPWVVTADELPPGGAGLRIRLDIDGRVMQESDTSRMMFGVARTIALLSDIMTLEPGDVIATGTPEGVGFRRQPPVWLRPGDRVTVEIEGIGALVNPVVAEGSTPGSL